MFFFFLFFFLQLRYIPTKYKVIKKIFSKGINQIYINTPDDELNFNCVDVNDFKCKPSYENVIPILIVLNALGSPIQQAQFNFAYLHENENKNINTNQNKYKIVLYKQKIKFGNKYFEVQEIFGIQKSNKQEPNQINNYASGSECVICLTEERDTVILPCRHMCLCNMCANVVRIHNTKCPICRQGKIIKLTYVFIYFYYLSHTLLLYIYIYLSSYSFMFINNNQILLSFNITFFFFFFFFFYVSLLYI
uniref:E3 ubiquitin-protein ligase n=1 Tax=Piliocolobus tephrosceles TaxID=591936 RepID=A0A8C9GV70_9PRIM